MKKENELIKFKKFEAAPRNPFFEQIIKDGFGFTHRKIQDLPDQVAYNPTTGELGGALTVGITKRVDRQTFVKMFTSDISMMLGLSPTAARIFFVIIHEIQQVKNTDKVSISHSLINEFIDRAIDDLPDFIDPKSVKLNKFGRTAYYRAMAELMENDIIAPCSLSRDTYWINPARLFNGDRILLAKQYIIDDKRAEEKALAKPRQMDLSEADDEENHFVPDAPKKAPEL